jgi:hypothetical protein
LASGFNRRELPPIYASVELKTLISWLNNEEPVSLPKKSKRIKQNIEMILVSLRAELLHDLFSSMKGKDTKRKQNTFRRSKSKFVLLTGAGILVAACQGFDGIVTMLSFFTLPSLFILAAGFIFSLFSIAVFCMLDLVKISESLGIKLNDSYHALDVYLFQLRQIKAIRKKIDAYYLAELSPNDLEQLEQMLSMLQKRFRSLVESSKQFDQALNSENMQIAKSIISGVSGLLFFGSGFFAGQSVALFVAGMVFSPMTSIFWPVIIFSAVVGGAALSIYWYVERPELKKLVSDWFGLNEESVEQLCDKNLLAEEERKLVHLKEKVVSTAKLTRRLTQLEQGFIGEKNVVDDATVAGKNINDIRASTNFYSFLKPPSLLPVISAEHQNNDGDSDLCCIY